MSLTIVYSHLMNNDGLDYLEQNLRYLIPFTKKFLFILPVNYNFNLDFDIIITRNNNFKDIISNHIYSLMEYDSVIMFNYNYIISRPINEILYGDHEITSILSDSNNVSLILNKFSTHYFSEYLNDESNITSINDFPTETVNRKINSLYTFDELTIENYFPIIHFSSYSVLNNIIEYNHMKYNYESLLRNYELTIKGNRYLTIYCYYEKEGYSKNQTNLSHFIKEGLFIDNMDYIFIINGYNCSIEIPDLSNIRVIRRDNCTDFEGWYLTLQEIEWQVYKYIFFINCSVIGPLNFDGSTNIIHNWFSPFLEKMNENTVLCSNVITVLPETNHGGAGKRCTSYNFLLDTKVIPLLLNKRIFSSTILKEKSKYYNAVFSKKNDRNDAIFTGEYGLSRVLLKAGYEITCLHPGFSDRNEKRKNRIKMTLFMKNNWIDGNLRACPPCGYHETMKVIGKEIIQPPEDFNYNNLNCQEQGICYSDSKFNWNNKKEFYEKFGYSEEINL